MATAPAFRDRPLSAITADLQYINRLMADQETATDDGLDAWERLYLRREALEAEFDAVFYATHRVSWELAAGARA